MSEKAVIRYLNLHPQDVSLSPRINLFNWAREEIARQMGIIDKDIVAPPVFFLDGREISREDVINSLNKVSAKINQLMEEKENG